MKIVRTRFAPSPTGFMHVGNLRTALYTYFYARKNNGTFILRIEDTDTERYVEGAVDIIYKTLKDAKITWDEGPDIGGNYGPYIQSNRKDLYEKYAEELVAKKEAYYCFCSKERLASLKDEHGNMKYDRFCLHLTEEEIAKKKERKETYVIRQKMPTEGNVSFDDLLFGQITAPASELEDQILLKSDKMPTYNFANVVDDHLMGVTDVLRGTEYLSSTPKYNLLYKAFGWEIPRYIHLSPIMKDETHKLSKRYGDANFDDFIAKGYLPEAIVNYICLLGWAPKDNEEKFTIAELIERFDINGLKKSGSIFDLKKLQWFNGEYLKDLSIEQYVSYLRPFLEIINANETEDWYYNISVLFRDRLLYGAQIIDLYQEFFNDNFILSEEAILIMKDETVSMILDAILAKFKSLKEWTELSIINALKEVGKEQSIKGKMLYMPTRIAITGEMHGPDLGKTLVVLGKDKVVSRLENFKI